MNEVLQDRLKIAHFIINFDEVIGSKEPKIAFESL